MRIENPRMRERLAHRRLWRALGWLLLAAIVVLTLIPPPEAMRNVDLDDKLGHVIAYALLMLWFAQLYFDTQIRYGVAFVVLGIALEFAQGALGYRSFEYADMTANAFGVVIGALLAATGRFSFLFPLDRALAAAQR